MQEARQQLAQTLPLVSPSSARIMIFFLFTREWKGVLDGLQFWGFIVCSNIHY